MKQMTDLDSVVSFFQVHCDIQTTASDFGHMNIKNGIANNGAQLGIPTDRWKV